MRSDRERLLDMREAIERIEKYTSRGREALRQDELIQVWVVYFLQVIGEAAHGLSDKLRDQHAEIPWSKIIGMRNILAHRYFGIDADIVWAAVDHDLPELKRHIESIVQALS